MIRVWYRSQPFEEEDSHQNPSRCSLTCAVSVKLRAPLTMQCWSTASAKTSNWNVRVWWQSLIRSNWSSTIIRKIRSSTWKQTTIWRTSLLENVRFRSDVNFTLTVKISWRIRRRNISVSSLETKCVWWMHISWNAQVLKKMKTEMWQKSTVLTIRRQNAEPDLPDVKSKEPSTG